MRLVLLVAAILTTAACGVSSPSTPWNLLTPSKATTWRFSGTVSGMVDGRVGGLIAGARLTVLDGANRDAQVATDSEGRYAFAGLERGRFSVVIAAPGFVSVTPVVDLYRNLEVDFALKTR